MKKVRMIIKKTTIHCIDELTLTDDCIELLQKGDDEQIIFMVSMFANDRNIKDGNYEIEDLEVME